jgi:hypothetical protein
MRERKWMVWWSGFAGAAALALAPGQSAAQKTQAPPAAAQKPPPGPAIYPAQGQSPEQQAKDKAECNSWATQQTGFDPAAAASQAQQAKGAPQGGGAAGGAAKGAAAGAAVGAIGGHAGTGAATGAAVGGMASAKKKKQAAAAEQQASAQQLQGFQKAFGACMQGRGYSVGG